MKILLFIGRLSLGGAERQLINVANGLSTKGHEVTVCTLFPHTGLPLNLLDDVKVKVVPLCTSISSNPFSTLLKMAFAPIRLRRLIGSVGSDVIYSMLYLPNFIAWLATRGALSGRLVWGIRSSNMTLNWKRAIPQWLCARVSASVPLLIVNSHSGNAYHRKLGYRAIVSQVIVNGIDTEKFVYSADKKHLLREELSIPDGVTTIGIVGRLDPMKDYQTFLDSAALVKKSVSEVIFVCVGSGSPIYTDYLKSYAKNLGVDDGVVWLGSRDNMQDVYPLFDLLVSSSAYGEGFSNSIGEAMACGIPCVVTDVGDSVKIVSDLGLSVPHSDSNALANAIIRQIDNIQSGRCDHVLIREQIANNFSIAKLVDETELSIKKLVENK
ncbi:glycosyltransferase [Aestuariirhabdus sp. LZHN29]|uniref:glycosyltransferase n=1 Tax=Aestuariirhabdus sp. LZHN29 TaxID=3417462 RepID=UPI003CEE6E92